jgi:hypothetical protein
MNWNLPNPHLRKTRKNKGTTRGPRKMVRLVSPGSLGLKSLFKHVKAGPKVSTRGIAVPTGFLNTKRRVILMTGQGKYISKTAKGVTYNPKAKYHKSPGGTERSTKYLKNLMDIPLAIRPKFDRKERSNILKKRAPYAARVRGVRVLPVKRSGYLTELFEGYPAKRGPGRPRKVRSPGPGPVMRRFLATRARKAKLAKKRASKKSPFAKLMASLN